MNSKINSQLKENIQKESFLVRESSIEVLKEFEKIDDLADESKSDYFTKNKSRFIKPLSK